MNGDARGPAALRQHQGPFVTAVGGAFPGERAVFRGRDLHHDLLGQVSWVGLLAQGITGRCLSPQHLELIEHIWVATSYPDARIWNNRVAALAGTARSTANLAMSAALAVTEASIYGQRNEHRAAAFFIRTHQQMLAGMPLAECIAQHLKLRGKLAGYGRPLASGDERIEPIMAVARRLGLADGPHVALAFAVERHLQAQGRPMKMNYGALAAALGADMGLSPREFTLMIYTCFLAGMPPCYLEALQKPPGAIMPLACTDVAYEGVPERLWPPR